MVLLSKLTSHTCEAISERDSTSPRRRARRYSSANSLEVRSIFWPARTTRRRMASICRSATSMNSLSRSGPRRRMVRMRSTSSAKAKGLTI
ncbi:hypothetical protein D3C87_1990470 [compost metagenome]